MCRLCGERPPTPSRAAHSDYRCTRCIHRSAAGQARRARYNAGPKRQAVVKRHNDRRLYIGGEYHSAARSGDQARRINAHIKERKREFISRFKNREEAEGAPAR